MKKFFKQALSMVIALLMTATVSVVASANGTQYEQENNNTIAKANLIDLNKKVIGNLSDEDDVDYYKFKLNEPSKISFSIGGNGSDNSWFFSLITESENPLYDIEDNTFSGKYIDDDLKKTIRLYGGPNPKEGIYYIRINARVFYNSDDYYFTVNSVVENTTSSTQYEKEDNGFISNANLIENNKKVIGNLNDEDDVDYYKFKLNEPSKISFSIGGNGSDNSWFFSLITESENPLYDIEDNTFSGKYIDDDLKKTIRLYGGPNPNEGIYYIRINTRVFYNSDDYYFTINSVVENATSSTQYEKEDNGFISNANLIENNKKVIGNLNDEDDADYFSFTLDEKSKVDFEVGGLGNDNDWNFSLLNKDENVLYDIDGRFNSSGNSDSMFESGNIFNDHFLTNKIEELQSGTYYIKINTFAYYNNADYYFKIITTPTNPTPSNPTPSNPTAPSQPTTIINTPTTTTTTTVAKTTTIKPTPTTKKLILSAPSKITITKNIISWSKVSGAKKYQIKIFDVTKRKSKRIYSKSTSKLKIKGKFSKKHKYQIRIRAVAGKGKNKIYSAYKIYTFKYRR